MPSILARQATHALGGPFGFRRRLLAGQASRFRLWRRPRFCLDRVGILRAQRATDVVGDVELRGKRDE